MSPKKHKNKKYVFHSSLKNNSGSENNVENQQIEEGDIADNKLLSNFIDDDEKVRGIFENLKKFDFSKKQFTIEEFRKNIPKKIFDKNHILNHFRQFDFMNPHNDPMNQEGSEEQVEVPNYDDMLDEHDQYPTADEISSEEGAVGGDLFEVRSGMTDLHFDNMESLSSTSLNAAALPFVSAVTQSDPCYIPTAPSSSDIRGNTPGCGRSESSPAMLVPTLERKENPIGDNLKAKPNQEQRFVQDKTNNDHSQSKSATEQDQSKEQNEHQDHFTIDQSEQEFLNSAIRNTEKISMINRWNQMIDRLGDDKAGASIKMTEIMQVVAPAAIYLTCGQLENDLKRIEAKFPHIASIVRNIVILGLQDCMPNQNNEYIHKRLHKVQVTMGQISEDIDKIRKKQELTEQHTPSQVNAFQHKKVETPAPIVRTQIEYSRPSIPPATANEPQEAPRALTMAERRKMKSKATPLMASATRSQSISKIQESKEEATEFVDLSRPTSAVMVKSSTGAIPKKITIVTRRSMKDWTNELLGHCREDISHLFPILTDPHLNADQMSAVHHAIRLCNDGSIHGARALIISDRVPSRRLPTEIVDLLSQTASKEAIKIILQILSLNGKIE